MAFVNSCINIKATGGQFLIPAIACARGSSPRFRGSKRLAIAAALTGGILAFGNLCRATVVPRLTFENLVDGSERIAHGRVERSWVAWDPAHRFIWTHYLIRVTDNLKGSSEATLVTSEPGGALDGINLLIPGVVTYSSGEEVVVFVGRVPNGFWRASGYGQGKYSVIGGRDPVVRTNLAGAVLAEPLKTPSARSAVYRSFDGVRLSDFKAAIRARLNGRPDSGR